MYKHTHDLLPLDLLDVNFFRAIDDIHHYPTRKAGDFHIHHTRTVLAENTLKTQGALLWNTLPAPIKSSCSLGAFKNNFKKHLISKYLPGP